VRNFLLSDLHLDPRRPQHARILLNFLSKQAEPGATIYLLGDIFEAWVGDDDDSSFVGNIAQALKEAAHQGAQIFFMHGNRDFLLGSAFAERAGMTLLDDPCIKVLGGIETLLTHGDRYCTTDTRYQDFRRQSRNPSWQAALLSQPLADRRALAARLRAESMAEQKGKLEAGEMLADAVEADLIADAAAHNVVRMIHGHTHRPAVHHHTLPDGRTLERVVLSDWREMGEALEVFEDGTYVRHVLA
jgi:UDP-2,3-diacylglucosamine hydrolase